MIKEGRKIIEFNHRVRLKALNWDKIAQEEIITGEGFRITEKGLTEKSKDKEPGLYSIHSKLFGTEWNDENTYDNRYSCACGLIVGKHNTGKICPECKTECEFIDIDFKKTAWIILDNYKLIQPLFYEKIKVFIDYKKNILYDILNIKDGDEESVYTEEESPFSGIGIIEFKKRFNEIIDYYLFRKGKPTKTKMQQYEFLMLHEDKIFTSCIPVYSKFLRHFFIQGEEVRFTEDDTLYKKLFSNSQLLNDRFELDRRRELKIKNNNLSSEKIESDLFKFREENILMDMQRDLNKLWNFSFEAVDGKEGQIKAQVLGGGLNGTARNVIIPDPTLNADEIGLGYITFLELYKMEIISTIKKVMGVSTNKAHQIWKDATKKFSKRVYDIIQYLIKNMLITVRLNRNPTINYGSQMIVRVVKSPKEINNHTLQVPLSIISPFNADFDGDEMNTKKIVLTRNKMISLRKLNPRFNLFVSRNDGLFNNETNLFKDQMIGLHAFLNI